MHATLNILVLLGGLLLAGAGGATVFSPSLHVTTITVQGASGTARAEAETIARTFIAERAMLGRSPRLFLVDPVSLAHEIERQVPVIASARVLRRLPGIVELDLQEKVPVAFLEIGGHVYSLDSGGRTIADVTSEEARAAGLPLIRDPRTSIPVRLGDPLLAPPLVALLHDVVVRLPERFSVSAVEFTIPSVGAEEIHVRTDAGWLLLLDVRQPLAGQLGALEKVVTEELGPEDLKRLDYVDLRVPGKVYYRLGNRR